MSSTKTNQNRTDRTASLQHLADGLEKHATVMTSLIINGTTLPIADIIKALQALVAAA